MFSFCSLAASTPVLVLLLLQRLTRQKLGTIFKPVAEAGDFYPKFYGSFILNQPDKKEISNIITAAVTAAASAVVVVYVLVLLHL